MSRSLKGLVAWTAVAFVIAGGGSPLDSTADTLSGFAGFPLWKDVPVREFATLHEGRSQRGTRWGVYAFNRLGGGAAARKSPCILLASISSSGEYGYSSECGPLAPSSGPQVAPVTVGSSSSRLGNAGGESGESFWAMTFAGEVRRVELEGTAPRSLFRTSLLSLNQSKKAHLQRFRYLAFSVQRNVCPSRILAKDAGGATVLDAAFSDC